MHSKTSALPLSRALIGLLIGAVVIFISNSSEALDGLRTLLAGPVEDGMLGIGRVLYYAAPIIMTGLSVGFAFKTGLFNIGTPGQFIIGAFAAVYVGVKWTFLPGSIHWLVAILAAFAAGGLWAVIPGVMKAYLNVNEVISSNHDELYRHVSGQLFRSVWVPFDALRNQSLPVATTAVIPKMGFDKIFTGSPANGGFVIAILFVILIYIILNKTSFGTHRMNLRSSVGMPANMPESMKSAISFFPWSLPARLRVSAAGCCI